MTPQDVLRQAADLIERTGWCRRAFARDKRRRVVGFYSKDACRFCVRGAIYRVGGAGLNGDIERLLKRHIGTRHISDWNDAPGRTKDEVIATLRRAAEMA